jgi:agmatinase
VHDPRSPAPTRPAEEPTGPGFLGVDCDYDSAKVVLLPVPYDLTTTYVSGTRRGPQAILDASHFVELNDEELGGDLTPAGIHTLPPVPPLASGPSEMIEAVELEVASHLGRGKIVGLLGGEHSITLGAVRAHHRAVRGLSVLQLDAHADLRASYEGSPFSHACVMRRVHEIVPAVQVGIRSLSSEESAFAKENVLPIVWAREVRRDRFDAARVVGGLTDQVYVTVDCDVFDPAFMPAVGTPEPGGLDWYDVIDLLDAVSRARRIVGFDVVELNPLPGLVAPDFMAARLVYRLLALALRSQGGLVVRESGDA